MNHRIKLPVLFTALVFFFSILSCKKSHTGADPTSILEGHSWKITALTANPAYYGITDIYNDTSFFKPCSKDNFLTFNQGNALIFNNGQVNCDPSDPQTYSGTWNYDANTKILLIQINGFYPNASYHVFEINENSFSASLEVLENGVTYSFIYRYQRQ